MSLTIKNGIIASPGIKMGKAYVCQGSQVIIPKYYILEQEIEAELQRFETAIEKTKADIEKIQNQLKNSLSKDMANIFSSHLMVLEDPLIDEKTKETIKKEKRNAEWVLNDISIELISSLSNIKDEYLKERIIDVSDIHKRLIGHLQKFDPTPLSKIKEEVVVFATNLTPSETAIMNKNYILAFVTDQGGKTSHTSIMARAMEIPAIVGTMNATSLVKDGDFAIVDAINGLIIINPSEEEKNKFKQHQQDFNKLSLELTRYKDLPAITLDSEKIFIYGNIEIPEEKKVIKNNGAQGIGLYRSEFLFMDKKLPDEERQFREYKRVVEFFNPAPVTIRTIDVGGDKIMGYTDAYKERNPFLGCRAIRFSLENINLFKIQLRAILRASHYGNTKLMFPMITTIEEFKTAKAITTEVMEDLKTKGIPYDSNIEIGLMIEIPSAVINADILAKYADFFSIGTNDLVQYVMAVDRINEKIAYLYNPLNLAFIKFLKQISEIAKKTSTPISICGEIAGEPLYTMLLLGLGYRQLSMSATYMHQIKKIIRSVTIKECQNLVEQVLQLEDTEEIEKVIRDKFIEKNKISI